MYCHFLKAVTVRKWLNKNYWFLLLMEKQMPLVLQRHYSEYSVQYQKSYFVLPFSSESWIISSAVGDKPNSDCLLKPTNKWKDHSITKCWNITKLTAIGKTVDKITIAGQPQHETGIITSTRLHLLKQISKLRRLPHLTINPNLISC